MQAQQGRSSDTQPVARGAGEIVVATLALAAMIGWLNGAALSPFLPAIAADLGTTVPRLGQVTTIVFLLAAAISLVAGPVADARGARRVIVAGLLAVVVCSIGTALAQNYWILLATRVTGAISSGTLGGVTLALAATLFSGDQQRRAISWVVAGVAGGAIVGIPLLSALDGLLGWRGAFVALAGLAVGAAGLVHGVLPDDVARQPLGLRAMLKTYPPLIASPHMRALYLASALRSLGWMGFLVYAGAFFSDEYGSSSQEIGWIYMIGGLGFFAGITLAGGRLGDRPLRTIYMASSGLTGVALGASLALPVELLVSVGLLTTAALLLGVSSVCLSTLLAIETPAGRATTMTLNSAVLELGTAGGGAAGGALIAVGGYATLGAGLLLAALLSALLVRWAPARRHTVLSAGTPGQYVESSDTGAGR